MGYDPDCPIVYLEQRMRDRMKQIQDELFNNFEVENDSHKEVLEIILMAYHKGCALATEYLEDRYDEEELACLTDNLERYGLALNGQEG